jgi:hypothetical protein
MIINHYITIIILIFVLKKKSYRNAGHDFEKKSLDVWDLPIPYRSILGGFNPSPLKNMRTSVGMMKFHEIPN